jgi:predicted ester cyclase
VNKKNVQVGNLNFAADFVDHGADVPPGPAGAIANVGGALQKFPDLHVTIDEMIAEVDRVVVPNHRSATDSQTWQAAKRALQQLEQNKDRKRSS